EGNEANLGRTVNHRDLVVVLECLCLIRREAPVAVGLEDPAYPLHAECRKLGRSQGTHACAPEDMDTLSHRPQNFLVPDGRNLLEVAVDDPQRTRPMVHDRPIHVSLLHRRQIDGIQYRPRIRYRERRPGEYAGHHAGQPLTARARGPGTYLPRSPSSSPSRP